MRNLLVFASLLMIFSGTAVSKTISLPTIVVPGPGEAISIPSFSGYGGNTSFSSFGPNMGSASFSPYNYPGIGGMPPSFSVQPWVDVGILGFNGEPVDISNLGPGKIALGTMLRSGSVAGAIPLSYFTPLDLVTGLNNIAMKVANAPGNVTNNRQAAEAIRAAAEKITRAAANGQVSTARAYNALQQLTKVADSFAKNPNNFVDGKVTVNFEAVAGGGYDPQVWGPVEAPPSSLLSSLDVFLPGIANDFTSIWNDPLSALFQTIEVLSVIANLPPVAEIGFASQGVKYLGGGVVTATDADGKFAMKVANGTDAFRVHGPGGDSDFSDFFSLSPSDFIHKRIAGINKQPKPGEPTGTINCTACAVTAELVFQTGNLRMSAIRDNLIIKDPIRITNDGLLAKEHLKDSGIVVLWEKSGMLWKEAEVFAKQLPNGTRAIVTLVPLTNSISTSGHSFNFIKRADEAFFFDAQSGKVVTVLSKIRSDFKTSSYGFQITHQ